MTERTAYDVLQVTPGAHDAVIRAAYRALAAIYHPDHNAGAAAAPRMAELNDAYAKVRTADRRGLYDRSLMLAARASQNTPAAAATRTNGARARAGSRDPAVLDFGRYQGWRLEQLVHSDPDYLRWLGRHSSGTRYRREIEELLAGQEHKPPAGHAKRR